MIKAADMTGGQEWVLESGDLYQFGPKMGTAGNYLLIPSATSLTEVKVFSYVVQDSCVGQNLCLPTV